MLLLFMLLVFKLLTECEGRLHAILPSIPERRGSLLKCELHRKLNLTRRR